MATQTGITISAPNEPYTVVSNIPRPTPGPTQALVKSLYVGLNPVEPFMHHTGVLITSWPAVIGSDVSGVVLEVGTECKKVKKGDYIFTCVPVGMSEFSPFQEAFLVEEDWVFKKEAGVGLEEACTVGAGLFTAGLALLDGQALELPEPGSKAPEKDSWVIVMGGSGSVGRYCVQLASLAGYKVLASCSPSKNQLALEAGASATFNNRAPIEEQLAEIEKVTGGKFGRIVDTSVMSLDLSVKALEAVSKESDKYFATVDDWSEMAVPDSLNLYRVKLGMLGRTGTEQEHITAKIAEMVALFQAFISTGQLRPLDYHLVGGEGWDAIIAGIADMEAGKLPKKPVVKAQTE